ncbi:MAG: MFS transporter [Bacillota bacterium]|nr:MFS transporter [Bacillota bacterium]
MLENDFKISGERRINYKLNFILLISGRFISDLGSAIFGFALSLYVLDFTNSAAAFSLVLSFSIIPNMFVSIIAGSFVDKHDKKKTIVVTDILSGIAVLIFMCIFHLSPKSIILFIFYKIILAVTQSFFGLAISTSIPNIVGEENTPRANSIFSSVGSLINILGPVIGAIAYKTIGLQYIFLIDGISFILSGISEIFLVMDTKNTEKIKPQKEEGYFSGVRLGFQYIANEKITTFFLSLALFLNVVFTPLAALMIPYINYNVLKVSGLQLSIIQGSWAAGAIIGGFLMSLKKDTFKLIKNIFILIQAQALIMIMFCFPNLGLFSLASKWTITIIFSLLLIALGILNVMQNVPLFTYFQIQVPEKLRGRVFAVFNITIMLSSTIGLWLYGGILEHAKWGYILVVSGIVVIISCILLNKNKSFKKFNSTLG